MDTRTGEIYSPETMEKMRKEFPDDAAKMVEMSDREVEQIKQSEAATGGGINYRTRKGYMRNKPCPCGSGKKFKKCHWSEYKQYLDEKRRKL